MFQHPLEAAITIVEGTGRNWDGRFLLQDVRSGERLAIAARSSVRPHVIVAGKRPFGEAVGIPTLEKVEPFAAERIPEHGRDIGQHALVVLIVSGRTTQSIKISARLGDPALTLSAQGV